MADDLLRFGLKKSVIQKINAVFSHYPEIEKAVIYGSRAKGNYRIGSDIDLTLFGNITYETLNRISVQLDDLYLPYSIDLSLYNYIDTPELLEHIRQVGKVFWNGSKGIKSFVRRAGRLTARQKHAIETSDQKYLIDISAGMITLSTAPVTLEIGFGMGHSFLAMAKAAPDTHFIGVEVYQPGIGTVLAAIQEENLQNILLLTEDAKTALPACIPNHSLDCINIFFPDPWPKQRHHKRRLLQPDFVILLQQKLKPQGRLHLATDWEDYAHHMLAVLSNAKGLKNTASDGSFSQTRLDRPMTKYEKRGLNLGHPVWDLVFTSTGET